MAKKLFIVVNIIFITTFCMTLFLLVFLIIDIGWIPSYENPDSGFYPYDEMVSFFILIWMFCCFLNIILFLITFIALILQYFHVLSENVIIEKQRLIYILIFYIFSLIYNIWFIRIVYWWLD